MVKEKIETKKLKEFKETEENKTAAAKSEGNVTGTKEKKKEESKPAVAKIDKKKDKKVEGVVELEREYIVPLRKGILKVPEYRRAKKAVKVLKEFMVQHMNVRDGDLRKVKVNIFLNNEIWFKGIRKPMNKIKVKAKKIDGIVYVELADVPEAVKYKMARAVKISEAGSKPKVADKGEIKEKVDTDKDKDGVEDKVEEKEDVEAESEMDAKAEKMSAKIERHSAKGEHKQKVASTKGLK